MCEQAIEWSSICRFLNFFICFICPTFYGNFYGAFYWKKKRVLDRCKNRSTRNCVDWAYTYIQWIIQAITFIFRWMREREKSEQNPQYTRIVANFKCVAPIWNSLVRKSGNTNSKRIYFHCSNSILSYFNSMPKFHQNRKREIERVYP